jgi:hypothetical protein
VTLQASTVSGNKATDNGGGINNVSGILKLQASTLSGNTAGQSGGGLATNNKYSQTLQNCTISGNSAYFGGGIYNGSTGKDKYGTLTATNCTIAFNKAMNGGGLFNESTTASLKNTIVSDNRDAVGLNDLLLAGGTIDAQYCLIERPNASINGANSHNILFVSAQLGPLQNNGGPTLTLKPAANSKALRNGSVALLTPGMNTDQRGLPRTFAFTVDIGAVEASLDYRRGW